MKLRNFKGALLLSIAAFIWGTAFVAQSMGMEHIGPFTFNGVRTLVGGVVLLPIIFFLDSKRKKLNIEVHHDSKKNYLVGGFLCGIILFAASSLQQVGLQYTTAGKAGFLTALYIVIVPIIGIFMKRKAGIKIWISVAIAAVGTYLLSVTEGFSIELGDLLVIICAVIFSFHIITIDHYSSRTDAIKLSCMQFLTAGTISMVVAFIFENPQLEGILMSWGPILYAGIMSSGVAYTLQIIGQRDTPPAIASLIMSLESVFAVLAGLVVLNEQLTAQETLGCVLVFSAVILAQIPSLRKKENTFSH